MLFTSKDALQRFKSYIVHHKNVIATLKRSVLLKWFSTIFSGSFRQHRYLKGANHTWSTAEMASPLITFHGKECKLAQQKIKVSLQHTAHLWQIFHAVREIILPIYRSHAITKSVSISYIILKTAKYTSTKWCFSSMEAICFRHLSRTLRR